MANDIIDINVIQTVETVEITVTPNLTTVNINQITGGGGGGGGGVTNLSTTQTDTNFTINSDTGDDAIVPLGNGTLAGATINDYTTTEKTKLAGIATGAEVNVNADWDATTGDAQILNKPIIPSTTNLVPYTDAISDVNLGEYGMQLGNLEFDNTPTNIPTTVGAMYYNDTDGTLDLILKGGNVKLQIGQETVARVVNKTATNITLLESNYQIVRVTGAQGQRPKVDLALANNDLNSTTTLGLVTETILNNQEGFITTSGQVQEINTTGSLQGETWADGDVLYLSGTVAGRATNIKPIAPIHTVIIGFVEYAHINQGKIFVKVDNGYELEELHNVSAIAPNNNEVLTYDTPTLLWKPKTIATILGYTPFNLPALTSGSVLFSNGTTIAQDNANFFWDNTNKRLNIGGIASNTARVGIKAAGALSTDIALRVRNSADTGDLLTLDGVGSLFLKTQIKLGGNTDTITASSNSGFLDLNTSQGIKMNPGSAFSTLFHSTGNVLIGTTVNNGGKLQIKAPGALSTDIALRVRNSADTADIIKTTGNGVTVTGYLGISADTIGAAITLGGSNVLQVGNSIATDQFMVIDSVSGSKRGIKFGNQGTIRMALIQDGEKLQIGDFVSSFMPHVTFDYTTKNTGIGTITPNATSILELASITKGFLPPRMTNAQRIAIATPAVGLMVYCTDATEGLYINKSTGWTFII